MKRVFLTISTTLICIVALTHFAHADLNNFLADLNSKARADISGFNASLSAQFNVPLPQINSIMKTVKLPADAFMCFQLSQMTGIHIDKVVGAYERNNAKGWGVIAKDLGIKPGSPAFHALKQGDFVFDGKGKVKKKKGKGKSKGKKDKGKKGKK